MSLRWVLHGLVVGGAAVLLSGTSCRESSREAEPAADAAQAARAPDGASQPPASELSSKTVLTADARPAQDAGTSGGRCQADQDCVVTRLQETGCCEDCVFKAAPKTEVEARMAACGDERSRCPMMACAPPRFRSRAMCREGRCELLREDPGQLR